MGLMTRASFLKNIVMFLVSASSLNWVAQSVDLKEFQVAKAFLHYLNISVRSNVCIIGDVSKEFLLGCLSILDTPIGKKLLLNKRIYIISLSDRQESPAKHWRMRSGIVKINANALSITEFIGSHIDHCCTVLFDLCGEMSNNTIRKILDISEQSLVVLNARKIGDLFSSGDAIGEANGRVMTIDELAIAITHKHIEKGLL